MTFDIVPGWILIAVSLFLMVALGGGAWLLMWMRGRVRREYHRRYVDACRNNEEVNS
jgi:preprotein translocase subunit YajC